MMNYDFTVQSANPMQGINNALQTYGNVRNIQLQEEQAGLQRQEYAQKQEAEAAQKARAQRYQSRLSEISEDPSPKNILGLSVEFPEASEAHERVFKMADTERQNAATQTASNIFTAFNSGKPEIAQGLIQKHLEAAKNSGDKGNIDFYTMFSEIAEENPKQAQAIAGQMLTATKEGRESLKALDDSENMRAGTRKLGAETRKIDLEYRRALEMADFDQIKDVVQAVNNGVSFEVIEETRGIKPLAIKAASQASKLKKLEADGKEVAAEAERLKLAQTQDEMGAKVREKIAIAETAWEGVKDIRTVVQRLKNNPELRNVVGPMEGRRTAEDMGSIFSRETLAEAVPGGDYGVVKRLEHGGNARAKKLEALSDIELLKDMLKLSGIKQLKAAGVSLGATSQTEIEMVGRSKESVDRLKSENEWENMLGRLDNSLLNIYDDIGQRYGLKNPPLEQQPADVRRDPQFSQKLEAALNKYGAK